MRAFIHTKVRLEIRAQVYKYDITMVGMTLLQPKLSDPEAPKKQLELRIEPTVKC